MNLRWIMAEKTARVYVHDHPAGILREEKEGGLYRFSYLPDYAGPPVSLTMPVREEPYLFQEFPPFLTEFSPRGCSWRVFYGEEKLTDGITSSSSWRSVPIRLGR
jgi:serine/threonine-protein kinase HipA